jgi:outer membrane receptor protein involved in Fe transport
LKLALITILLQLVTAYLWAQDPGTISGRVTEKGKAVEFVNVYVTNKNDSSKIVAGAVSDNSGRFRIEKVPPSTYQLTAQMVGYSTKRVRVSVSPGQSSEIGDVEIQADLQMLNAVEVSVLRNSIQKTEEGFVVNASANITQIGGTAADLLKNMPGVLVDSDGGLTLRGKTPLTLINGRVSGITGVDRSAQLERIPASSIERIEIINNPSAKYDADAEGGVINIILKKSEDNGTNGAFAVGAGLGDRYRLNASILLNHKTDKWNLGLEYDNWYTTRTRKVKGDRINYDLPDEYYLTQRRFDERLIFYQNAKATVDFEPTDKSKVSFEALWAFPGEDNNETLKNTFETSERVFTGRRRRHSNEIRRSHAVELVLNFNKKFSNPDKHLFAIVSNSFGDDKENTDITNESLDEQDQELNDIFLQRTHTYQKTNLTNVAFDYAHPVSSKGLVETGYKSIFRFLNADFERASEINNEFVIDPLNTNVFEFNEQIHAGYAQYTGWTGEKDSPRWKYNAGLRAEQVLNKGATKDRTTEFENDYFNLFPSANLFYYTKKQNNFKLSYSRRINRPGLGQLNPFTDITDSLNQRAGNPRLKPELIHSVELGYNHSWSKASFSLTGFYRQRNNATFPYTILDENGVAFTQPLNFGKAFTEGVEVIASTNPISSWGINFSFSTYQLHIDDEGAIAGISTEQVNWYAKLINNFTLFRDSKLQIIASYTAPSTIPQGESIDVYYVDIGFQQKIIKGKGRLGLTVTDIFNTQKYGFNTSDNNFQFSRIFKLDTRAVMLTFGYAFGTSFKEKLMENRFKND